MILSNESTLVSTSSSSSPTDTSMLLSRTGHWILPRTPVCTFKPTLPYTSSASKGLMSSWIDTGIPALSMFVFSLAWMMPEVMVEVASRVNTKSPSTLPSRTAFTVSRNIWLAVFFGAEAAASRSMLSSVISRLFASHSRSRAACCAFSCSFNSRPSRPLSSV